MSTHPRQRDAEPGAPRGPEAVAARFAQARIRALSCLIAGALLLPGILAVFWFKSHRIDPLAIGLAMGVSTLVELLGVAQLVVRGQAMARYQARRAKKGTAAASSPLEIQFCRRSLGRLGSDMEPLLTALRERGHSPLVKECLNRCQDCNLGMLVATVDGMPLGARDGKKLLDDLDELAVADDS